MKAVLGPGRWAAPLAAGIVFVGAAARLATVAAPSVWYDEAFHIFVSRLPITDIITTAASDTLPPLSYLLLHGWMALAGQQEAILRFFVIAWGILTVPLTYVLGVRLFSRPVGLAAEALVALGPFFLYWTRELRMYSQMTFLSLLLAVVFLRAWRRGGMRAWFIYTLVLTASLYTHSLSVLTVGALDVFGVYEARRSPRRLIPLAVSHLAAGMLYLPWLLALPDQMTRVFHRFWILPPHPFQWLLSLADFLTGVDTLGDTLEARGIVVIGAVAATAVLLIPATYVLLRLARTRPEERPALLLLLLLLSAPILALYAAALARSLYADRALGICAVALALLVARAGTAVTQKARPMLIAAAPLLVLLPWFWWALMAHQGVAHLPFSQVTAYIQARVQPGDAVVYNNKASYFPAAFYGRFPQEYFLPHPPGSRWDDLSPRARLALGFEETPSELAVSTGAGRVWLVLNLLDTEADVIRLLTPLQQAFGPEAEAVSWRDGRLWLFRFDRGPAGRAGSS